MRKFFLYDNVKNEITLNEPEILLVREFFKLMEPKRNVTKKDPTGKFSTRAFKEFKYLWLFFEWTSPYEGYTEQERHIECLKDSELTDSEFNDPLFREACRKYRELQNSSRSLKLIKSAQQLVDKICDYFDTIDVGERDELSGKPIYKVKDIMAEMKTVSGVIEELQRLESMYKKEQEAESDIRGDVEPGFSD